MRRPNQRRVDGQRRMDGQRSVLGDIYDALLAAFGPQHWWPADTATEVVIGAILTQNTAWPNVEKAITSMKRASCLDLGRIRRMDDEELAAVIRSAGTYRSKARRLKDFAEWLFTVHDGDLAGALAGDLAQVRQELLGIRGIGPETADAILLYAAHHPSFVVDAYTKRILRRHHLIDAGGQGRVGGQSGVAGSYEAVKSYFEEALPADAALFNEYHALLVELGKRHCRSRAICEGCPLQGWAHDGNL